MNKQKQFAKPLPPKEKILPHQRRPVKRAGGESPLTIRTSNIPKYHSLQLAMKPRGNLQAVLFHRKGSRNS